MIRLTVGWLYTALLGSFILWRESGDNAAVFCYRMGSGLYALARTGGRRPYRSLQGESVSCLNPFATCSTRFMTSKD